MSHIEEHKAPQSIHSVFGPIAKSIAVGQLVQLDGWPQQAWAEVIQVTNSDAASGSLKIVRYSADGSARFTELVRPDQVRVCAGKFDIPPMDFISGSVDLCDGKLGIARRRWPVKISSAASIPESSPERLH